MRILRLLPSTRKLTCHYTLYSLHMGRREAIHRSVRGKGTCYVVGDWSKIAKLKTAIEKCFLLRGKLTLPLTSFSTQLSIRFAEYLVSKIQCNNTPEILSCKYVMCLILIAKWFWWNTFWHFQHICMCHISAFFQFFQSRWSSEYMGCFLDRGIFHGIWISFIISLLIRCGIFMSPCLQSKWFWISYSL